MYTGHKNRRHDRSTQECLYTDVVFVPPGATSIVQPIHVVSNCPLKTAVDKMTKRISMKTQMLT